MPLLKTYPRHTSTDNSAAPAAEALQPTLCHAADGPIWADRIHWAVLTADCRRSCTHQSRRLPHGELHRAVADSQARGCHHSTIYCQATAETRSKAAAQSGGRGWYSVQLWFFLFFFFSLCFLGFLSLVDFFFFGIRPNKRFLNFGRHLGKLQAPLDSTWWPASICRSFTTRWVQQVYLTIWLCGNILTLWFFFWFLFNRSTKIWPE